MAVFRCSMSLKQDTLDNVFQNKPTMQLLQRCINLFIFDNIAYAHLDVNMNKE